VVVADVNLTSGNGTDLDVLCADKGDTPFVLVATPNRISEIGTTAGTRPPLLAFPARPVEFRELPGTVDDVIASRRAGRAPADAQPLADDLTGILAESVAMRAVMRLIDRAASCATRLSFWSARAARERSCWLERYTGRVLERQGRFSR
jgi:DNA-binding NtrC family response regulator